MSLVFALTGLLYFGLGAATGPLADRYGPRALCMAGAAAFLGGLVIASRAEAVWQVYLSYSLFVGSGVAACYVPSVAAVERWFVRRRALASGIAVSGIGFGTIVAPPVSSALIDAWGWRPAMVLTGIGAGALGGAAAWALERSPAELGLRPDGGEAPPDRPFGDRGPLPDLPGLAVGEAVRTKAFAWLYAAGVLATAPVCLALGHIVPYGQDEGLSLAEASLGLTGIGVGSMVGRLLLSPFGDRLGRRTSYGASIVGMAPLTYAWFAMPLSSVPSLVLWGALFGSAYGAFVALSPTLMADYFGTRAVSGIIGVFYTAAGVGALAGPWLGGIHLRCCRFLPSGDLGRCPFGDARRAGGMALARPGGSQGRGNPTPPHRFGRRVASGREGLIPAVRGSGGALDEGEGAFQHPFDPARHRFVPLQVGGQWRRLEPFGLVAAVEPVVEDEPVRLGHGSREPVLLGSEGFVVVACKGLEQVPGELPLPSQRLAELLVVESENLNFSGGERDVRIARQLDRLAHAFWLEDAEAQAADVVKDSRRERVFGSGRAGAFRDRLRCDRDGHAVAPEEVEVEHRSQPCREAEGAHDAHAQRHLPDLAEAKDDDGLAHRTDSPGESVEGGVADANELRRERLVGAQYVGKVDGARPLVLGDGEHLGSDRRERRQFLQPIQQRGDVLPHRRNLRRAGGTGYRARGSVPHRSPSRSGMGTG